MLTTRGWWLLFVILILLLCGMLASHALLMIVGLSFLAWFGWEWFVFNLRANTTVRGLRVERIVEDERGPVSALWFGRTFNVNVRLHATGRLSHVRLTDFLPYAVSLVEGVSDRSGPLAAGEPLGLLYRISCPTVGVVRFEGARVQVADLQGFFQRTTFVTNPVVYRVLPMLIENDLQTAAKKRHNQLLPPGIHRLKRPGSGSELLDLRDYMTGDPPKTIAWKVSARRDKLITKEFESEVPVRCTLFVDASNSVRVPTNEGKPIHRLITIAASVVQANSSIRDLTGLCAFDEDGSQFVRPDRSGKHLTNILKVLADAAAQTPILDRIDPESLMQLAYSFACEVYPDMMDPGVNTVPLWGQIMDAFPTYRRRGRTFWEWLHHLKRPIFTLFIKLLPTCLALVDMGVCLLIWDHQIEMKASERLAALTVLSVLGSALFFSGSVLAVPFLSLALLTSINRLGTQYRRKRLAALLSVRYGLAPGGLATLLEDDDQFALLTQRFLSEHQVPYRLPLYDAAGRYLFAGPKKVTVLATALLRAVGKGRDNELFVLLVDLLELDEHLEPLLRSVRVALGRHHQVIVVCPWPPRMRPPGDEAPPPRAATLEKPEDFRIFLHRSQRARFTEAYHRLRHTFARLGVPLVCAASDEPVSLILKRLDRLRSLRRSR